MGLPPCLAFGAPGPDAGVEKPSADAAVEAVIYGSIAASRLRLERMQTQDDSTVKIPNNKILTDVRSCGDYGAPLAKARAEA